VRFGPVSLGSALGGLPRCPLGRSPLLTATGAIEGIVGFDIGLGNDRTVLRPYLGGGQSAKVRSGVTSTAPAATAGLELDHYLTRFLSIGEASGLDTHIAATTASVLLGVELRSRASASIGSRSYRRARRVYV